MSKEFERKWLVKLEELDIVNLGTPAKIVQGYICTGALTVRVRIVEGYKSYLTIKSIGDVARDEYEYHIPTHEALKMISACEVGIVEKWRYLVPIRYSDKFWQVDVYGGDNEGLATVEREYESMHELNMHAVDLQHGTCELPSWIGRHVSTESRYKNALLASKPFKEW